MMDALVNDDRVDYHGEENEVRLRIVAVLKAQIERESAVDEAIRHKIESQKRSIPEGSPEWDLLYRKYYEEEPFHLAQLLFIVLAIEEVPLRAALGDAPLLGLDLVADGLVHCAFPLDLGLEHGHDSQTDFVLLAVVVDPIVIDEGIHHQVGEVDDLFVAQSHGRISENDLSLPGQFRLDLPEHFLVVDVAASHLVAVFPEDFPDLLVQAVLYC